MPSFYAFLDSIQSFSLPLEEQDIQPVLNGESINTHEYIYGKTYKFNRFDTALIQYIEDHYTTTQKPCFFRVELFDERFRNPRYYQITTILFTKRYRFFYDEVFTLNHKTIIDDLYYKRFLYTE